MKTQTAVEKKERPILFSGAMVKKILLGEKSQTRRIVKPQPKVTKCEFEDGQRLRTPVFLYDYNHNPTYYKNDAEFIQEVFVHGGALDKCPFGKVGDLLWVRETFQQVETPNGKAVFYKADERFLGINIVEMDGKEFVGLQKPLAEIYPQGQYYGSEDFPLKPSIFMPRWASRITLEITDIRVERLQEISESDAKSEGVEPPMQSSKGWTELPVGHLHTNGFGVVWEGYVAGFKTLWDKINAKRGYSWQSNPFVWVIEFQKI